METAVEAETVASPFYTINYLSFFLRTEIVQTCYYFSTSNVANLDLGSHDSSEGFRKGQATDTHSCDDIREVPEELRTVEAMYTGINVFYQKYTEAYGIPVLGKHRKHYIATFCSSEL